jgi:hypothetical protein
MAPPDPLAAIRERTRDAEKKHAAIGRIPVPIDAQGGEMLVELVERGAGKTTPVLQQALKIGLQVMHEGHVSVGDISPSETMPGPGPGDAPLDYTFPQDDPPGNGASTSPLRIVPLIPSQGPGRTFGSGVLGGPARVATSAVPVARPVSEQMADEHAEGEEGG